MTHLSILGQSAHRVAAQLLPAAILAPVLVSPAAAQPLAQAGGLDGSNPGQFFDHNGVVVDRQGNLYVADSGNNRVERRVVIEVANPPAAGTTDAGGD